tara:strand:+ start:4709 stop:5638 length:930 start_codon:yes stop_codon:yes gene_type:complete
MAYTLDTIERFGNLTGGFDLKQLLTDFFNFNQNDKPKIYSYYEGNRNIDGEVFDTLDILRADFKKAIRLFELNRNSFVYQDDWDLFSEIEDIATKLNTVNKSSKYLRSSIQTGFDPNPLVQTNLKSNQTIESLARDLNSDDPQNDWTNIFLNNNITEEDYTADSGTLLNVTFNGSNPLIINSVVDNIDSSEKIYGIDVQKELQFSNDDLVALSYEDTLKQTIDILASLTRGDSPEFRDRGIDKSVVIGQTYGSLSLPVLFRQLYENFATDDSFKSFSIVDAELVDDYLRLTYRVQTRADEVREGFLTIN